MNDMIVIDCAQFSTKEAAHAYLADVFGFPAHYGGTLDALFDCLTERPHNTRIALLNAPLAVTQLGDYGRKLLAVLDAATRENPRLALYRF
ncbi:MAG: barstar family protein [Christensenellales bacterium]|jgi:RNAse (barnase) inhibitor barstar